MYKFIGGDQREYGPVSVDQIRQWIGEGRANGDTLVQAEGSNDWAAIKTLSDFAEALATQAARASAPAISSTPNELEAQSDYYAARAANLDIWSCMERSWKLVRKHSGLLVGASAVVLVVSVLLDLIPLVGTVANAVLGLALWGGLDWLFLKLIRGQRADFLDTFVGFQISFVPLMLAGIVTTVLVSLGLVLCLIPGIYLIVAWLGFSPLLIIDKRMDFWSALELSRKVVTTNWWSVFALFVLTAIVFLGGLVGLLIGVFFTLPLATGAVVYAYEDIFGNSPSRRS